MSRIGLRLPDFDGHIRFRSCAPDCYPEAMKHNPGFRLLTILIAGALAVPGAQAGDQAQGAPPKVLPARGQIPVTFVITARAPS